MSFEKVPNLSVRNVPAATQYGTFPDASVSVPLGAIPPPFEQQPDSTPQTILTNGLVVWFRADIGITLANGKVSSWATAGGAFGPGAAPLTNGTAAQQPTYATTAGPRGLPSIQFDGTDDRLVNASFDFGPPGTEPIYFWAIIKQRTFTGDDRFWSFDPAGNSRLAVFQSLGSGTPFVAQGNNVGANPNNGLTLNTFKRLEVLFSNSTGDYVRAGSAAPSTGTNAGNLDPAAGFVLGGAADLTSFADFELCEYLIATQPTAEQRAALDRYVTDRYGPGLV
jgi:hypothetical protein